jgi:hypothetical protein
MSVVRDLCFIPWIVLYLNTLIYPVGLYYSYPPPSQKRFTTLCELPIEFMRVDGCAFDVPTPEGLSQDASFLQLRLYIHIFVFPDHNLSGNP